MTDGPRVLALVCKNMLAAVDGLDADVRRAASNRIDPAARAEVDGALRIQWVPLARFEHLAFAVGGAHGVDRHAALFHDITLRLLDQPVFSALASGALKLFGGSARSLGKMAPKGFDAVFKDCGALAWEPRGALVLRGLPTRGLALPYMWAGFRGAFSCFYAFTRTTGRVVVESTDDDRGDAVFRFED